MISDVSVIEQNNGFYELNYFVQVPHSEYSALRCVYSTSSHIMLGTYILHVVLAVAARNSLDVFFLQIFL